MKAEMNIENFKECLETDLKYFKHKSYFNYHLNLYQDFRELSIRAVISYSEIDEYNWIIGIDFFFWKIEYSWNSRIISKDQKNLQNLIKKRNIKTKLK